MITDMEIDAMPAGREMDMLIARQVMEIADLSHLPIVYEEGNTADGKDGWSGFVCPRCRCPADMLSQDACCQGYSTDISAAWLVVETMIGSGSVRDCFIEHWSDREWFVASHPASYSSRQPTAHCDGKTTGVLSVPLAICRWALKVKGEPR